MSDDKSAAEATGDGSMSQAAGGLGSERRSPHHLGSRSPERAGPAGGAERLPGSTLGGRKVIRKARHTDPREKGGFAWSESRQESRGGVPESEGDMERNGPALRATVRGEDKVGSSLSVHTHPSLQAGVTAGRERSHRPQTRPTCSRVALTPTPGSRSTSALQRPPIRAWAARPPPLALGSDTLPRTQPQPSGEEEPPWTSEVRLRSRSGAGRTPPGPAQRSCRPQDCSRMAAGWPGDEGEEEREGEGGEPGEEEEEDAGSGAGGNIYAPESIGPAPSPLALPCSPGADAERRRMRREKNRVRSQRRRQRRREIWRQSRQQDSRESSTSSSSSGEDEEEEDDEGGRRAREGLLCAVCLDVYFSPYTCHPCSHVFCEPCLRTLAKGSPANTPCPLCRTTITHVFFQKELNQTVKTKFPKEYLSRKQSFQRDNCAAWPLPSTRKLFRFFGGFQRQAGSVRGRFPRGGGYRVDHLDSEDEGQGWHLDMDMAVVYIYSANWVIGFLVFFFLCYLFFPSF